MQIYINDSEVEVAPNACLRDVLEAYGLNDVGMAVAVNGKVVARNCRDEYILEEGSKILVIKAVCGG